MMSRQSPLRGLGLLATLLFACAPALSADESPVEAAIDNPALEAKVSARVESLRDNPKALETFLTAMPKGTDLHNHLTGAVYAESLLGWAKRDGMCLDKTQLAAVFKNACALPNSVPIPSPGEPLYDATVRAWSMKDFVPSAAESGHDHFFGAFNRFGLATVGHNGEMLADVAKRAAAEHVSYMELMMGLGANEAAKVAEKVWVGHNAATAADIQLLHDTLIANPEWGAVVTAGKKVVDDAEAQKATLLGCSGATPDPGCKVTLRYISQVTRAKSPHQVFAQLLAAFQLAAIESRAVGVNLVAAEDNSVALKDYDLHMAMLDWLYKAYSVTGKSPVHITLHAGELTKTVLAEPAEPHLAAHVRKAVELGHAERIGHGVDVLGEVDSPGLLGALAARNVLVEVCLTSNAAILGVSGTSHPLRSLLSKNVPVALSSDDPGIARSSMTLEYVRAVNVQRVTYRELKSMARAGFAHAFAGEPLKKTLLAEFEQALAAFETQAATGAP
jgi:adenosine deaminase